MLGTIGYYYKDTFSPKLCATLRSKFHICGIDSSKINRSIAATTQENLISILIRYGIRTLPEEDLGSVKAVWIT
jgi:hypothetical protein